MTVKYIVDHIPKNTPYSRRPSDRLNPTTITIHNTGNPSSTARNERGWLVNASNNRTASYHIAIDDKEAIECIPLDECAWHAGDGNGSASGNKTSIGIEICESGNYTKTIQNAVELVSGMLMQRGWGIDRLRRHYDWSGKICPRLMYDNGRWTGWHNFLSLVEQKINAGKRSEGVSEGASGKLNALHKEAYNGRTMHWIRFDKNKSEIKFAHDKHKNVDQIRKEHNADYAFNFPFVTGSDLIGDAVVDGKRIASGYGKTLKWGHFAVNKDGFPMVQRLNRNHYYMHDIVLQGSPFLIENGKLCYEFYARHEETNPDIVHGARQRTSLGIDKDGNLILVASSGAEIKDMAQFLLSKGATWAINGDGGGSTTLSTKDGIIVGSNPPRTVNHAVLVNVEEEIDVNDKYKIHREVSGVVQGEEYSGEALLINNGKSDVTYVPLRFFGEMLGHKIGWDAQKKMFTVD